MAFHISAFNASIANGSVLLQVAGIADTIIAPSGSGFLVPPTINKVGRVWAFGTNLTRVQLTSASLRKYTPFDIEPVNVGTAIESPARMVDFLDNPIPLVVNEELDAFGVQSNAGAQRIGVFVLWTDGVFHPVMAGQPFTVHWTASTTLVANTWSNTAITLDNGLPSGTFAIIGARFFSAGAVAARFVPRGGLAYRPGTMAGQARDFYPLARDRYGAMGEWMRFSNTTPPTVDFFSVSADTSEEGYLDLIQVG